MRKGWSETTLGEVVEASWGNTTVTKKQYKETGFTAFSASGPDGFVDWFEHEGEGVVLSAIGALCGKTWLAEGKWTPIKNTIWIKSKTEECLTSYLFLISKTTDLWPIRGQAQPFISLGDVRLVEISLPPRDEQKRIVDVVSSVDAYIGALQQQVDTARTAFLAICEEIFLTGENMKPLHEVATVVMGQSPEGSTCNTDGIGTPLLTGPTEFTKRIVGPPRQWTSKETKLSQSGDILFCVRGATAGRINIGNYKSVIGRGLAAVRCNNSEDTNFVRFALLVGLGQLLPAAGGTIFPNISQSQLRNFEVSWPSVNRRAELSGLVRSIEEVVLRTEHAVDGAKKLRSGLLSDLLSGEHEIPESYDVFVGAA